MNYLINLAGFSCTPEEASAGDFERKGVLLATVLLGVLAFYLIARFSKNYRDNPTKRSVYLVLVALIMMALIGIAQFIFVVFIQRPFGC